MYSITREAVDESVHCEEDGDDEVGNEKGDLRVRINKLDESEGDFGRWGIETVARGAVQVRWPFQADTKKNPLKKIGKCKEATSKRRPGK